MHTAVPVAHCAMVYYVVHRVGGNALRNIINYVVTSNITRYAHL